MFCVAREKKTVGPFDILCCCLLQKQPTNAAEQQRENRRTENGAFFIERHRDISSLTAQGSSASTIVGLLVSSPADFFSLRLIPLLRQLLLSVYLLLEASGLLGPFGEAERQRVPLCVPTSCQLSWRNISKLLQRNEINWCQRKGSEDVISSFSVSFITKKKKKKSLQKILFLDQLYSCGARTHK